jgi:hypothetical protein
MAMANTLAYYVQHNNNYACNPFYSTGSIYIVFAPETKMNFVLNISLLIFAQMANEILGVMTLNIMTHRITSLSKI